MAMVALPSASAPPPPRFGLPEVEREDNLFNACFNVLRVSCPSLIQQCHHFNVYSTDPTLGNLRSCKQLLGAALVNASSPALLVDDVLRRFEASQAVGVELKTWKRCGRCGAQRGAPERSRFFVVTPPPLATASPAPTADTKMKSQLAPSDVFAACMLSQFAPAAPHDGCPSGSIVTNRDVLDMQQALLFGDYDRTSTFQLEREVKVSLSDRSSKTYRLVSAVCWDAESSQYVTITRDQHKAWWLCRGLSVTPCDDPSLHPNDLHVVLLSYLDVSRHFPDWRAIMPTANVLIPPEMAAGYAALPVATQLVLSSWPDVLQAMDGLHRLKEAYRRLVTAEHGEFLHLVSRFYFHAFHLLRKAAANNTAAAQAAGTGSVSRYASFRSSPSAAREASLSTPTSAIAHVSFDPYSVPDDAQGAVDAALDTVFRSADAVLTLTLVQRLRTQVRVERRNGSAEVATLGCASAEIPVDEGLKERAEAVTRARQVVSALDAACKSVTSALHRGRPPQLDVLRLIRRAPDAMRHVIAQRLLPRKYPPHTAVNATPEDEAIAVLMSRGLQMEFAVGVASIRETPTLCLDDIANDFNKDTRIRAWVVAQVPEKSSFRPLHPQQVIGNIECGIVGSHGRLLAYTPTQPTHTHALDTRSTAVYDIIACPRDGGENAVTLSMTLPGTSLRERFNFPAIVVPIARDASVVVVSCRLPLHSGCEDRFRHLQRTKLRKEVPKLVDAYLEERGAEAAAPVVAWIAVGDFRLNDGDRTDGFFALPGVDGDGWGYTWGYYGNAALRVQLSRTPKPTPPFVARAVYFRLSWTHIDPTFDELVTRPMIDDNDHDSSTADDEEVEDTEEDLEEEWDEEEEEEEEAPDEEQQDSDEEEAEDEEIASGHRLNPVADSSPTTETSKPTDADPQHADIEESARAASRDGTHTPTQDTKKNEVIASAHQNRPAEATAEQLQ